MPMIKIRLKAVDIEAMLWEGDNTSEMERFIGDPGLARVQRKTLLCSAGIETTLVIFNNATHQNLHVPVGNYVTRSDIPGGQIFGTVSPEDLEERYDVVGGE